MSAADWTNDLTRSITRMTENINGQVQRFTQQLKAQIQQNVQDSLEPALREANRAIESLPRDVHGRIISNNGNIIVVSTGNGLSRTIMSGHTPDGEPYVRDIEERYDGNILYHNETSYNPRTNVTERIRWKLDLATPGAQPEML
ncbi:uncharacterized protein LOC105281019 isoform X2 [Ooceraea biroi]|nr:uncharacterized protein LOC105281019 isoform X2 [Ooceraea biroi]